MYPTQGGGRQSFQNAGELLDCVHRLTGWPDPPIRSADPSLLLLERRLVRSSKPTSVCRLNVSPIAPFDELHGPHIATRLLPSTYRVDRVDWPLRPVSS